MMSVSLKYPKLVDIAIYKKQHHTIATTPKNWKSRTENQ
jgi:hypothetical protein